MKIMKQLIKIMEQNGKKAVSARELHAFLESKTKFNDWFNRRIEEYGFVENQDFEVLPNFEKNPSGGRPLTEYALTVNCAKELSMLECNEQGRKARQYFIACEKLALESVNNQLKSSNKSAERRYCITKRIKELDCCIRGEMEERKRLIKEQNKINLEDFEQLALPLFDDYTLSVKIEFPRKTISKI